MLLSRKKMATAIIFAIIAAPAAASFTTLNQAVLYEGELDQVAGEFAAYYDWMWKDGFQAMLKTEFDTCEQYNDHSAVTPWREEYASENNYVKVPNQDYLQSVCPLKAAAPPAGDKSVFRIRSAKYPSKCLEKLFHYDGFKVTDCHAAGSAPESNGQWFYFKKGDAGKSFLVTYQADAVVSIRTQSDGCDDDLKANILWDADTNLPLGYVAENWLNEYAMEVATESTSDGTYLKFNQDHASDTSRASETPYLTANLEVYGDIRHFAVQTCVEKDDSDAGWHFEAAVDNSAVELPGGFATGTCYRGDGTVRVISASTRTVTDRKLSEIKAGDKVLTLDKDMRKVFTSVKELRHSKSVTDFVEITMRGQGGGQQSVAVTEHHTFPSCAGAGQHRLGSKHGRKEKPAFAIKAGDCLFTGTGGESVVESVQLLPRKPQDVTYTVQLEQPGSQLEGQAIDLLVLNGIVTHAKPSHSSSASGHQATNQATTKQARENGVLSASKHSLRAHRTLPATIASLAKEGGHSASFRSPAMARSSRHRHLSAEDECDDECKNMDPACAKYGSFCKWSDVVPVGVVGVTVCDTPSQLMVDRGLRSCAYGPAIVYNVFKYEENLCSCQSSDEAGAGTCADTTTTSNEGDHCHAAGMENCETDWGSCNEDEHNPKASSLYSGFLSGKSFAFELGNADSSDTRVLSDTALRGAVVGPGGYFSLPDDVTSGVLLGAEVYGGEFVLDGTSGVTEVVFVQVVTDPTSTITFNAGAVVVMGGSNAGTLLGLNKQDSVRLTALSNTGVVRMEHSVAILITDTVNEPSGEVTLIGCQASVHGVVNKGTVNLSGGEYSYKDGTNEGTINVDGDGVQAVYKANNAGTINVAKGLIYATLGTNTGTINISDGVTGEFIVETKNSAGNWGTIMYKGAVVTADINDGKVYIARHA